MSIQHHFALVYNDAFCFPVFMFLLFHKKNTVSLWFTPIDTEIRNNKRWIQLFQLCVTCIDLCANEKPK